VLKQSLVKSGLFATENEPQLPTKQVTEVVSKSTTPIPVPDFKALTGKKTENETTTPLQQIPKTNSPSKIAAGSLIPVSKPGQTRQPINPVAPPTAVAPKVVNGTSDQKPKATRGEVEEKKLASVVKAPSNAVPVTPTAQIPKKEDGLPVKGTPVVGGIPLQLVKQAGSEGVLPNGKLEHGGFPSNKLSNDASRAPDAQSSPGSTTQTATTPAVHDISTDTSPDNESSQYLDAEDEREVKVEPSDHAVNEDSSNLTRRGDVGVAQTRVPDAAEAQLLQESMGRIVKDGMIAQPNLIDSVPAKARSPGPRSKVGATVTPVPVSKSNHMPSELGTKPQVPQPTLTPVPIMTPQVPDSQDSTPTDRMDIDKPSGIETPEPPAARTEPMSVDSTSVPDKPSSDASQPPLVAPPSDRAVTRVSSGAMRQRSVSEILGETPRVSAGPEKAVSTGVQNQLTPITPTPRSPTNRARSLPAKRREKPKNQLSTVVFGKQPKKNEQKSVVASNQKHGFLPNDDYFTPLFVQGFTTTSKWMKPIEVILNHAHKTVSTPDAYIAIQDNQACRVLRRVYHLQQHDKWSLRQPKRCPEPTRLPSHWDVVLQEMKWMRTDFREERKWKMALAKKLAHACAEWVDASAEDRKALQVPAVVPPKVSPDAADVSMAEMDEERPEHSSTFDGTVGIDASEIDLALREALVETVAPSEIFALQEDDVVFALRISPAADQLLQELPLFGSPLKIPRSDLTGPEYDPDVHWRRPALPLSKYVEGQMKLIDDGPPRKRSRYQYEEDDVEDEVDKIYFGSQPANRAKLPPESADVALFNPEMKSIRDRLHAGHQFRPPSEHPMPLQNFYETRSPSQWTWAEDDELRTHVREYSYNWSLISTMLTTKSMFASGAERRTPWECFERWINLEGLPTDMQKTQYFKAYNNRIEAAQRVISQQNQLAQQAQQQAAGSSGPVTPLPRRRPSTPLRVERRRNQKHLTLIDAMRKLAKKRETAIQKQQHAASVAAVRKANEAAQPRGPTKTPRDYSLMRWERDQALAEKMAQYAQRQEAQRRVSLFMILCDFNFLTTFIGCDASKSRARAGCRSDGCPA
jgi:chromatin modification-related protein VID21